MAKIRTWKCFYVIMILVIIASVLGAIMPVSPVQAATPIYVNAATGNDSYDGTSPIVVSSTVGPKLTIQAGINAVDNNGTVNVAAGTYNERITLKNGVQLKGAGAGVTTIDGGNTGIVVYTNSVGSATVLDGFTITHGGNCIDGGGMFNYYSSPIVTNCIFFGNSAERWGGGMYNLGLSPTVTNCIFSGNSAGDGGGMFNDYSSPKVTNCTFFNNSVTGGSMSGSGIYNAYGSYPIVTNCILWGDGGEEISNYYSSPVVTYCDIQGGYSGSTNINTDPLFVDAMSGNLHLRSTSPCVDSGNNTAPSIPATDFEGQTRIYNGIVDMGADEYIPGADLSVTKDADPSPVNAGEDLTYTITVINNGPDPVVVTCNDTLPAGVIFKSADPSVMSTFIYVLNTGFCSWFDFYLDASQNATLTLVVTVPSITLDGAILSNTATVTGNTTDPCSTNNEAHTLTSVINRADLSITKLDSPDPVNVGTNLTYNVVVTNNGPGSALGVEVLDTLPPGLTFKSAVTGNGSYNSVTGNWSGFNLPAGQTAALQLVATVNSPAVDLSVITNTAQVSSNTTDPDTTNNAFSQNTTVYAPVVVDPKTVKLVNDADHDGLPGPGDTLQYTAVIKNTGHAAATGVVFTDTPDSHTTLVNGTVTTTKGSIVKGNYIGDKTVEVAIGTIAAGAKATITFEVTINNLWVPVVSNQALTRGTNFAFVLSDDPNTPQPNDPTRLHVQTSPGVPGTSFWGIGAMILLLGGAMVLVIRRRQIRSETH